MNSRTLWIVLLFYVFHFDTCLRLCLISPSADCVLCLFKLPFYLQLTISFPGVFWTLNSNILECTSFGTLELHIQVFANTRNTLFAGIFLLHTTYWNNNTIKFCIQSSFWRIFYTSEWCCYMFCYNGVFLIKLVLHFLWYVCIYYGNNVRITFHFCSSLWRIF